jgi:hypothetical protein
LCCPAILLATNNKYKRNRGERERESRERKWEQSASSEESTAATLNCKVGERERGECEVILMFRQAFNHVFLK